MVKHAPAQRVWEAALGRLQIAVPRPTFDTWLRNTTGLSIEDQSLVVEVPTTFTAAWLQQRMHGLIEEAVSAVAQSSCEVSYRVRGAEPTSRPDALPEAAPPPPGPPAVRTPTPPRFNDRYTFQNFVVGPSNQLAYAVAQAVATAPGASYNPLFLYGGAGLGKTHLLHAIAQQAIGSAHQAVYVTTEQFTNEFLVSIRDRRGEEFRERYRSVDILLIDDIQFLIGKEGTQEGFFHTFNALRDAKKQVVISSDRPPAALALFDERLRSRLEWGLAADIGTPDYETRAAILLHHARSAPVAVPDNVIAFIAERIPSNIRNLEGCLNRITALAHFTGQAVTIDLAANAVAAIVSQQAGPTSPKAVIDTVASYYNVPTAALLSSRRDKTTALARQVTMHLLRHVLGLSPEEIGEALGKRDRTTVIYALKQITRKMEQDSSFATKVDELRTSLSSAASQPDR